MHEHVEGSEGVYVVDTLMFGMEEQAAAFVVDGDRPAVIDTGLESDGGNVVEAVDGIGIGRDEVEYIVVTHVHLDHAGGLGTVADAFPNATVVAHERGVPYLTDDDRAASLVESVHDAVGGLADAYGGMETVEPDRVRGVEGRSELDLGDRTLELFETTGHAPHHLSLYDDVSGALFVVDEGCAYYDGREVPTTPPPDFDYEATVESFDEFEGYDADYLLYGHYGVNYDGGDAVPRHRDALRDWVDEVREAWEATEGDDARENETVKEVVASHPEETSNPIVREVLARDVRGVLRDLSRHGEIQRQT